MKLPVTLSRTLLGLVGAAALTVSAVAPSLAANDVTQVINGGGNISASVASATLAPVTYSDAQQSSAGTLNLSVSDPRGTAEGWYITLASSNFVYTGSSSIGQPIPKAGFVLGTPGSPVYVSGQAIQPTGPVAASGGSLDTARKTITAAVGTGSGSYTQALPSTLVIPAFSQTGSYLATLTVTISNAP